MTDPKKDACESTGNKRGPSKQSREAERQRVEYVMDLREIIKKAPQVFQLKAAFQPQHLPMRKRSKSRSISTKLSPRSAVDVDIKMGRRIRLRRKEPDVDRVLVLNSAFSLRLLRAYTAIKDKAVQRRFVILVEMIAASQR
jgi:hypothetical protein